MPTPPANPEAKTAAPPGPGVDGDRLRTTETMQAMDTDGAERSPAEPRRLGAIAQRSGDDVRPVVVDRAATGASPAVLADASTVRRLADAAQALRRTPERAVQASDPSDGANENSYNHDGAGQNILFQDGHVAWYTTHVINGDNIWDQKDGPDNKRRTAGIQGFSE